MKKRIFAVLLLLILCLLGGCAKQVDGGEWVQGLTWAIYDDGSLVIKGSGPMDSCEQSAPWNDSEFSFQTAEVQEGVTGVSCRAFAGCGELTSVTLPAGLEEIGAEAFAGCAALTDIVLPDSVTDIGEQAFKGCSGLTQIAVPAGVTSIRAHCFDGCAGLTAATLPEGVTEIGDYAFAGCVGLTDIVLPDDLTAIGASAFYACSSLPEIDIPAGVTSIGASAFNGCSDLSRLGIAEGVTSIGESAFKGCSSLTRAVLPQSLTDLGNYAFEGCRDLANINIPRGVTELGAGTLDGTAFQGKLKEFLPDSFADGLVSASSFTLLGSDGLRILPLTVDGDPDMELYRLLPEKLATLNWEDADYALIRAALYEQRNDYSYVGSGKTADNVFNTRTGLYLTARDGSCARLADILNEPPETGYGVLYGAEATAGELWEKVKDRF